MKKSNLLTALAAALMLFMSSAEAQTVLWAKKGISEGFENGNAIVADDSGNVYVTGQLEFTSVFDNFTLNSYGQHDILLAKYGPDGVIKWIRQAGGKGGDIGNGIGIDAAHNVYITGEIEDTAKFGNITLFAPHLNDGFIAKYDVSGNIVWAKSFGAELGSDKGRALTVSPSGNIYLTGNFTYNTDFGTFTLSTAGANDMFVVKMNTNGDFLWAKQAGGTSHDRGYGIAIDPSENVFVTGTFTNDATFGSTTITGSGLHSTFLAKYNTNGSFQWVKGAGDCCDTTKANSIALDGSGNIYVAGYFMDHTKFGSYQFTSVGLNDAFVVKYDPNGNVVWARQGGGVDEDGAYGVAVDDANNRVYVTGLVRASGNFGSLPYTISGYKDIFVTAYDLDGNETWLRLYGGRARDVGNAIAVNSEGYIYTTGLFNGDANFGPFLLTGYPNQPWADFYVDKILPPMAPAVSIPSTNLALSSGNCADLDLTFTPGNGNGRIVVVREGAAVNAMPANGTVYSASNNFGSGSSLGNGNYVVYSGTGNQVSVTGLVPGNTYYFSVFEYSGGGVATNYLVSPMNSASGSSMLFTISVTGLQNAICIGDSLSLHASEAVTFDWSPGLGLSSTSTSDVIAMPLTTTTYTVKGLTAAGCQAAVNFTIVVNDLPSVSMSTLNHVCENTSPVMLSGGSPVGGIYSGTGISGGMFNPAMTGAGTYDVMYTYSDMNGCVNRAQTSITVNSLPNVSMNPFPVFCQNGSPVVLNHGTPAGGTYSGTGVMAGMFNPAVGVGAYNVVYSYTDLNGCMASAAQLATVEMPPSVSLGNDRHVCANQSTVINAGAGYSTYSWSTGATTQSITVDSSGTGIGMKNIFVVVSNAAGCRSSSTMEVFFDICAGINEANENLTGISLYPNPFRNSFTIASEKTVTYSIFDMCGRQLDKKVDVSGVSTAGEDFSPGVYFIEIISGHARKVYSVIKTE